MTVSLTPAISPRARGIRSALRATFTVMVTGMRPARLVPESAGDLRVLAEEHCPGPREAPNPELAASLLAHLRAHDPEGLRQLLQRRQLEQGLGRFVLDTIAPMSRLVGEAWARGELQLFEEHIFTEVVQGVLCEGNERDSSVELAFLFPRAMIPRTHDLPPSSGRSRSSCTTAAPRDWGSSGRSLGSGRCSERLPLCFPAMRTLRCGRCPIADLPESDFSPRAST
jgi:hypothetical protein